MSDDLIDLNDPTFKAMEIELEEFELNLSEMDTNLDSTHCPWCGQPLPVKTEKKRRGTKRQKRKTVTSR